MQHLLNWFWAELYRDENLLCFHYQMMGKIDRWGIDIFRLSDITIGRPLTAVAYTIFQVTLRHDTIENA